MDKTFLRNMEEIKGVQTECNECSVPYKGECGSCDGACECLCHVYIERYKCYLLTDYEDKYCTISTEEIEQEDLECSEDFELIRTIANFSPKESEKD